MIAGADFFISSDVLLKNGTHEADFRSCISRAYYAVFWILSEAILNTIPLSELQTASLAYRHGSINHEKLHILLSELPEADAKLIGKNLNDLR